MNRSFWVLATCLLLTSACKTDAEEAVARGNLLRNEGDLDGALTAYQEASRAAPERAKLHLRLGETLIDAHRLPAARVALIRALDLQPDLHEARLAIARLDVLEGDPAAAAAQLDQVIARDPKNLYALMSRGNLALKAGQNNAAVASYQQAVALDPDNPTAIYGHASALLAQGDREGARRAFETLETQDPDAPFGAYGLARLAATSDVPSTALPLLREALRRAKARHLKILPEEIREDRHLRALIGDKAFDALLTSLLAPDGPPENL